MPQKKKIGSRQPRIKKVPKGASPDGDLAIELGEAYGIHLFDWQKDCVRYALIRDKDGCFKALSFCMSVPRQNGKTEIIVVIILYFLLILGLRVLYTAHNGDTANEIYERVAQVFETNDDLDEISQVMRSNGKECIVVRIPNDDGTVTVTKAQFRTRSPKTGRGVSKVSLLIYDEAQALTSTLQSQIDALTFANGENCALTIYAGTPPDPTETGDAFEKIRNGVIEGNSTEEISYVEWSCEEEKDPREEKWWYKTNPSLGLLISPRTIRAEAGKTPIDEFNREYLGHWYDYKVKGDVPIKKSNWDKCAIDKVPTEGVKCFAVKFAANGQMGALAVCLKPNNSEIRHVEAIKYRDTDTLTWLLNFFAPISKSCAQIIIDGKNKSADLAQRLIDMGVPKPCVWLASTSEVIAASSMLESAINEHEITHFDQEGLNESACNCLRRPIGTQGGWSWCDAMDTPSAIIESVALAYYASRKTKRDPNRKGRIR